MAQSTDKHKGISVKVHDMETGKEIGSYEMRIPTNGAVIPHPHCCCCCTTVLFDKTVAKA